MKRLRDYQQAAVDSVYAAWGGDVRNPLVVAPTGSGKSLIIAAIIERALEIDPHVRIGVLQHRKELCLQNYQEFCELMPLARAGMYSAGLGARDAQSPIIFAGIQSLSRVKCLPSFDFCIVDEAHMIPFRGAGQYLSTLARLRDQVPGMPCVGLTATPYRLDGGSLVDSEGALFDSVSYDISVQMLIDRGYLANVVARGSSSAIDLSGVKKVAGEIDLREQSSRAIGRNEAILAEVVERTATRRAVMIFCATVEHAERVTERLRELGESAQLVTGETVDRDGIISDYKRGLFKYLVNVDVLTTGFNAPLVDCIVMLRATESTALYVQIVGRGMRIAAGKSDCLLLDYGSNVERHGPIDDVVLPSAKLGTGDGEPPVKECPQCHTYIHAAIRLCPHCSYEFPPPEPDAKLSIEAADAAALASQRRPRVVRVVDADHSVHTKLGSSVATVRITYTMLTGPDVSEWICPEHDGFPRRKYETYCKNANLEPCESASEHVQKNNPPAPIALVLMREGKYDRIRSHQWGE